MKLLPEVLHVLLLLGYVTGQRLIESTCNEQVQFSLLLFNFSLENEFSFLDGVEECEAIGNDATFARILTLEEHSFVQTFLTNANSLDELESDIVWFDLRNSNTGGFVFADGSSVENIFFALLGKDPWEKGSPGKQVLEAECIRYKFDGEKFSWQVSFLPCENDGNILCRSKCLQIKNTSTPTFSPIPIETSAPSPSSVNPPQRTPNGTDSGTDESLTFQEVFFIFFIASSLIVLALVLAKKVSERNNARPKEQGILDFTELGNASTKSLPPFVSRLQAKNNKQNSSDLLNDISNQMIDVIDLSPLGSTAKRVKPTTLEKISLKPTTLERNPQNLLGFQLENVRSSIATTTTAITGQSMQSALTKEEVETYRHAFSVAHSSALSEVTEALSGLSFSSAPETYIEDFVNKAVPLVHSRMDYSKVKEDKLGDLKAFFCYPIPHLSTRAYLERLCTCLNRWYYQGVNSSEVGPRSLLIGLVYFDRLTKLNKQFKLNDISQYRILGIAMLVASKMLEDELISCRSWGEVIGLEMEEVINLEAIFCTAIGFDFAVTKKELSRMLKALKSS